MTNCKTIALALLAVLSTGVAQAQEAADPLESQTTSRAACLVDEHLSVWLSLETADRMIAALEKERRELTEKLTQQTATLNLMDEGKMISDGVTRTGMPNRLKTGGREALRENCAQIETRLSEVSKTLKRRRLQRVRIEEWLNVYLDVGNADGS